MRPTDLCQFAPAQQAAAAIQFLLEIINNSIITIVFASQRVHKKMLFLRIVFLVSALIASASAVEQQNLRNEKTATMDLPACTGCTTLCSFVPPPTASGVFPCYQGTPADTSKCYYTDPLVVSGSIWSCNTCVSQGYPNYVQNDPIYTSMELWFQV